MIATTLIEEQCGNPLIILDDIDKVKSDSKSSMEDVFYTLLETDSAKRFWDEYLEVELNASKINWVATSNCKERVPAPILDRMQVLEIRMPTMDERVAISRMIYWDILKKIMGLQIR